MTKNEKINKTEHERIVQCVMHTANEMGRFGNLRAMRYGGNIFAGRHTGHGTTPQFMESVIAAWAIANDRGLQTQKQNYENTIQTTADYCLGTNPLNMSWVGHFGDRTMQGHCDLDGAYLHMKTPGINGTRPGFVPYGPTQTQEFSGNWWDIGFWMQADRIYPAQSYWPAHERWFERQFHSWQTGENTVLGTQAPSAMVYGFLCGKSNTTFVTTKRDSPIGANIISNKKLKMQNNSSQIIFTPDGKTSKTLNTMGRQIK